MHHFLYILSSCGVRLLRGAEGCHSSWTPAGQQRLGPKGNSKTQTKTWGCWLPPEGPEHPPVDLGMREAQSLRPAVLQAEGSSWGLVYQQRTTLP